MGKLRRIWASIKRAWFRTLWSFFPSRLPMGLSAHQAFADSVLTTYELPTLPSYRHAIATMFMHLGPQETRIKKSLVARSIKKAMVNQVAYQVIQDINKEEKEIEAKAKLKLASPEGPSLEQPLQV